MNDTLPSIWATLAFAIGLFALGSLAGRLGRWTSWKPALHIGAACMGIGEPALLFLYNSGRLDLDRAFYVGGAIGLVGVFGLGFAIQRLIKSGELSRQSEAP